MIVEIKDEELENVAALKVAMKNLITNTDVRQGQSSAGTSCRVSLESCPVPQMPC